MAQTTTTGMVEGLVRDRRGRPLKGVQVRLLGHQITRSAATDEEGRFHIGLLNPGTWKVMLERAGFQSLSSRLSVLPELIIPLRFELAEVNTATVEVKGEPGLVTSDPTSTSAGMTLTFSDLSRLPAGRNVNDLVFLAPTAGFAGTTYNPIARGLDYSLSGASGSENQFLTDGLVTTDLRFGGQGLSLVPEFVASLQVETSAFKPEANALGGVINTMLKAGSNVFQGEAWATWSPSGLEARAKSSASGFRQPGPVDRHDLGFGVSGPLVKDRLFYFAGLDLERRTQAPTPNRSGFEGADKVSRTSQTVLKVNGFLTPEQQLTGTWMATRQRDVQARAFPEGFGDAHLGSTRTFESRNLSLSYDRSFGARALMSLKGGLSWLEDVQQPEDAMRPYVEDGHWFQGGGGGVHPELAGFTYGRGGFGAYTHERIRTRQLKADAAWFPGAHALKVGVTDIESRYFRKDAYSGSDRGAFSISGDASTLGMQAIGSLDGAEVQSRYQTFYLQDTWEVGAGLRVMFGARAERQVHRDAEGRIRLSFTDLERYLQPRLGFTWVVGRHGQTLITGSFGVYHEQVPQRLLMRAWGNESFTLSTFALSAYDASGTGVYDSARPTSVLAVPLNSTQVAQGLRLPRRREWTLGLETPLPGRILLNASLIYRHLNDGMEDSAILDRNGAAYAYTPEGFVVNLLWNPRPGVTFVAPPGAVDKDGNPIGGRTLTLADTLFPEAWNKFGAISLGVSRRTEANTWSATYTWSHLWGTYEGLGSADRGIGVAQDNNYGPGFDAWPYVGRGDLGLDRRHAFKTFGSHRFPFSTFSLTLGGRWIWQSGLALSLQDDGSTTRGLPPGTLGLGNPLDPLWVGGLTYDHGRVGNHGRSPTVSVVDLHLDLEFRIGQVSLAPTLDIFNLFNTRTPTAIFQFATHWFTADPDPRYGQAKEWVQGRRVQVGIKARF